MLVQLIRKHQLTHLTRDGLASVAGGLFLYLFKVGTIRTLKEEIGSVVNASTLRKEVIREGYILKNCKLYMYARCLDSTTKPSSYGVSREDAVFIDRIFRVHSTLVRTIRGYKRAKYRAFSLRDFDHMLGTLLDSKELHLFIEKFISKKLRFLVKSFNLPRADISSTLKNQAIYALYRAFPVFSSWLHFVNVAKQAIRNRGLNLIKENTTGSRQRLTRSSSGQFSSRVVPYHSLSAAHSLDHTNEDLQTSPLVVNLRGNHKTSEEEDLSFSLIQLRSKLKGEKTKLWFSLMMGESNIGFSEWLGQDNTLAVEKMDYDEYKLKCCEYVRVSVDLADQFFAKLRKHL